MTLGVGLGMATPEDPDCTGFLRVAHMGHVNAHMTLGALAVMEGGDDRAEYSAWAGRAGAAARVVAGAA